MRGALLGAGICALLKNESSAAALLLLDQLNASPLAAYSVARRVKSAYSGPLCRLRRSTDNAEADWGTDGNNLLDTAAIASWVGGASAYVVTLYDQTGGAKHATNATAASQPRLVNAGVLDVINAVPAMVFTGSKKLSIAASLTASTAASAVCLFKIAASAGDQIGMPFVLTSYSVANFIYFYGGTYQNFYTAAPLVAGSTTAKGDYLSWQIDSTGAVCNIRKNNGAAVTVNNGTFAPSPSFRNLGDSLVTAFFDGHIQELLLFDGVLSSSDRATIYDNHHAIFGV